MLNTIEEEASIPSEPQRTSFRLPLCPSIAELSPVLSQSRRRGRPDVLADRTLLVLTISRVAVGFLLPQSNSVAIGVQRCHQHAISIFPALLDELDATRAELDKVPPKIVSLKKYCPCLVSVGSRAATNTAKAGLAIPDLCSLSTGSDPQDRDCRLSSRSLSFWYRSQATCPDPIRTTSRT